MTVCYPHVAPLPELVDNDCDQRFIRYSLAMINYTATQVDHEDAPPHYQERCHPSQSQTRGLDGADQCVVTARRSRLMSEGG